jgi:hypothetical protein
MSTPRSISPDLLLMENNPQATHIEAHGGWGEVEGVNKTSEWKGDARRIRMVVISHDAFEIGPFG